jgi:hypothetical protein
MLFTGTASPEILITEKEAKLPADNTRSRGIFLGPTINVLLPRPHAGKLKSPLQLKVKFENHGGATINLDTLLVTYMRKPTIDLTPRVRPFADAGGIDMARAEVPPGTHRIWIEVKDTNGESGWAQLQLDVIR